LKGCPLTPKSGCDVRFVPKADILQCGKERRYSITSSAGGHKAGVAGGYNYANYTAEREAALDMWAEHVLSLVAKRPFVVVAKAA
jgi:hypothetical protein